jgi:hypothetical protein
LEQAEEDQYARIHPGLGDIAYRALCP